jgi:hypothetical protein
VRGSRATRCVSAAIAADSDGAAGKYSLEDDQMLPLIKA